MSRPISEDLPNPAVPEVQQREYPVVPVPVKPTGPVTTHELPGRVAAARTYALSTVFEHVSGANLRRKRMLIIGSASFVYSTTGAAGSGITWPANVPLPLYNADHVYLAAVTTANVGFVEENWAD